MARRTRGRTRPGRLRALDHYLALSSNRLTEFPGAAAVVDVGIGEHPDTTRELSVAVGAFGIDIPVLALETDPLRLRRARSQRLSGVRLASWDALADPLAPGRHGIARVVRAMNLLRGQSSAAAEEGHRRLGRLLVPRGRLIEGSSDRDGGVLCAHVLSLQSGRLRRRSLLFFTDFSRGCGPWMFRDQLPADLRRACRPPHPVHALLSGWHAAFVACAPLGGPIARYQAAVRAVPELSLPDPEGLPGLAEWRPAGGVPRAPANV